MHRKAEILQLLSAKSPISGYINLAWVPLISPLTHVPGMRYCSRNKFDEPVCVELSLQSGKEINRAETHPRQQLYFEELIPPGPGRRAVALCSPDTRATRRDPLQPAAILQERLKYGSGRVGGLTASFLHRVLPTATRRVWIH
jgi:hypothetical protein